MTTPMPFDESTPLLVPVDTVAHLLQVSKRTVWRLVSAGKLVSPLRVGGSVRWRIQDIRDWIARGCNLSGKSPEIS